MDHLILQTKHNRRAVPRLARLVPPNLVGLCFNCLASDHIKAQRKFPARCQSCKQEGHRARDCGLYVTVQDGKRGNKIICDTARRVCTSVHSCPDPIELYTSVHSSYGLPANKLAIIIIANGTHNHISVEYIQWSAHPMDQK
jgi:hypothetical protein